MHHDDRRPHGDPCPAPTPRRAWHTPTLRTIRAGQAENGRTNRVADGPFSFNTS